MKKLTGKLKDRGGASVVIALIFLLVCVTVSAVVLTAASANSGHLNKQHDEQQAYLSVSSAAQLLRADLAKLTPYVASKTDITYVCGHTDHSAQSSEGVWTTQTPASGSTLAAYINEAALHIRQGGAGSLWEKTFTMTGSADELDDVDVTIKMDDSYRITCRLSTDASLFTLTLTVSGTASEPGASVDSSDFCEHLEWSFPPVLVGGEWVYYVQKKYPINKITSTMTVIWATGVIAKGESL